MIRTLAPQLLLVFLTGVLFWFIYRSFFLLRRPTAHEGQQSEPKKIENVAMHPSNPFLHSDVPEVEHPSIVVQSPIPPKKEYFVMRADSKTASVLGDESSDPILRQAERADMGDMSQKNSDIVPI